VTSSQIKKQSARLNGGRFFLLPPRSPWFELAIEALKTGVAEVKPR